jgi:hypothetical protein
MLCVIAYEIENNQEKLRSMLCVITYKIESNQQKKSNHPFR